MDEREGAAVAPDDGAWMRRALTLAERGWGQTAPNPMVGAVVVRDGVVVGEGWHTRYGAAHAEVEALRAAGDLARGATLYVALEPCNHQGQTPPCTDAILAAGVRRVVAAVEDPHPIARGGVQRLRSEGVDVTVGVEREAARELNASFFHDLASDRSFVRLKLATSLDGAIADQSRRPAWLTGQAARREVHRLRAGSDAVAVGIGTVLSDDPLLSVRDVTPPRNTPLRVVFDTSARLPLDSRLVRTARESPVVVVCWAPEPAHAAALEHAGVELLHAGTLVQALRALRDRGVRSLLVEGGATLASSLVQEALVDRLIIFRAPLVLGSGALAAFSALAPATVDTAPRWRIVHRAQVEDDEMTVYAPAG
ncbi:MAG TPA: bifunctional diaminohydroxyphosphoribosylaminopyrimidine deaminase/5-amino-6-(5-phosphoribosylamino)uracil reductase RibD [Gemmatimonadaceae bacterium]